MSSFDWSGSGATTASDGSASSKGVIKLTNDLGGTADLPQVVGLTMSGETQGSIIYFNGTDWVQLLPGTSGKILQTNGAGANPSWEVFSNSGQATINFGNTPGSNIASVAITGQTNILTTSIVKVFVKPSSTIHHNEYEHNLFLIGGSLIASDIVAGTGFTITAHSTLRLTGTFNIYWEWR